MSAERKRAEIFPGCEITEDDTVVDVGCGMGECCVFAGKLGADVIGIEVDPNLIGLLEAKMAPIPARSFRAILTDSRPIPLPDASADVIICTEVIEHMPDPPAFLAELVRIGKPGARYWLSVPDPSSEAIMAIVCPPSYFEFPGHINVFERERFTALLEGAGLAIDREVGLGFYHSFWWVLRMACRTEHYPGAPTPPPSLIAKWEAVWEELMTYPLGGQVSQGLDRVLPKSQVVIAHKSATARLRTDPAEATPPPTARGFLRSLWSPARRPSSLKD
jgi:SAM-dependent methyltransferase